MSTETRDTIRDFLLRELIRNPRIKLGDDDKVISGGLIDSFDLVQVGLFIEERFGFRPDDIDLTVEKMDTVRLMADYVDAHRK
ncbi:MAG: acyl carrier protein [Anaerolineae bacterium]|nr:acyl carrier protein [Anaerolineae bacterium]